MPIYEYHCPTCGNDFEKLMRMGADAPDCPECGGTEVNKKVSRSGFVLKGGGWYKDHYGLKSGSSSSSSSESTASSSDGGSSSKSDSGSSGKSDSAPASAAAK